MKGLIVVSGLVLSSAVLLVAQSGKDFQTDFKVDRKNLGVKGSNPYFNLTPGYRLEYKHGRDNELVTVLSETKMIDGVETRVVEDRESEKGALSEATRDYYAIDSATNDVYYFGEDVDVYKNGKVVNHEGSWMSGVKGAKFGLMMPAQPRVGQKFYQEQAPGVGMDRAEIKSVTETRVTPAGTFMKTVRVLESSAIEHGKEEKWYASGVGPVKDAEMDLVKYGVK